MFLKQNDGFLRGNFCIINKVVGLQNTPNFFKILFFKNLSYLSFFDIKSKKINQFLNQFRF